MDLQDIIHLAQQLHPIGFCRNIQTNSLKMLLDTKLPAVMQLLPQLAAVVCRDAQFLIHNNAGDSLLLAGTLDSGLLLVQQETYFLQFQSDKPNHFHRIKVAGEG